MVNPAVGILESTTRITLHIELVQYAKVHISKLLLLILLLCNTLFSILLTNVRIY